MFIFFLLSGFCSLTYEIVWLRLAYANFGVNTQVMSVVISVFMAGLALGSWLGGRLIGRLARNRSALLFYAAAEAAIGCGAFAVPALFQLGQSILLAAGPTGSSTYLALSALLLTVTLLPWCFAMGATFPFTMEFLRRAKPDDGGGFGFLYLANVIGAMAGALTTAVALVELAGFRGTLHIAAGLNLTVALGAILLAARVSRGRAQLSSARRTEPAPRSPGRRLYLHALFLTGLTSMGMEVAWVRNFTPVLGNQIYSFAYLLAVYLLATWLGSAIYRRDRAKGGKSRAPGILAGWASLFALWPVILTDPRLQPGSLQVLVSIMPFCLVLGYLTPKLVDGWSGGDPARAGSAYAFNILGCIIGPLAAAYLLLPLWGVPVTLAILAAPYFVIFPLLTGRKAWNSPLSVLAGAAALSLLVSTFACLSYDTAGGSDRPPREVRRDFTATVVANGKGMDRRIFVNGVGLTILTPVTKVMAHLPMLCLPHRPEKALVICFGMGTTFRSMASWGVDTTAVELVPSVRDLFGFFFADGPALLHDARFRVEVDDGRRFLMRARQKYGVITLDPPPPVEAAASSLLYSRQFYELARARLEPGGILAQWYPPGEVASGQATLRALVETFPYVRAFRPVGGKGMHFLASTSPIDLPNELEIGARMPPAARADLLEWPPFKDLSGFCRNLPGSEVAVDALLNPDPAIVLTDDRPYNEYYLIRRTLKRLFDSGKRESGKAWSR